MAKIKELFSKYWDDILKPVVVLLSICIVIPLALAVTDSVTKDKIAELETKKSNETMESLVEADRFEEAELGEEDTVIYHKALKGEETVGYIFTTKAKGYGGDVSVMTAVNIDGTVKSVAILDVSNETPGLGQNAAKEAFYSQYEGKKEGIKLLKNGAVDENNEIDAVTGATITSTAVTEAVNEALEQFKIIKSLSSTYIPESEVAVSEE